MALNLGLPCLTTCEHAKYENYGYKLAIDLTSSFCLAGCLGYGIIMRANFFRRQFPTMEEKKVLVALLKTLY